MSDCKPIRIRRILKWAGLGACPIVMATWALSLTTMIGPLGFLHLHRGYLVIDRDPAREHPKMFVFPPYYDDGGLSMPLLSIRLEPPVIVKALIPAWAVLIPLSACSLLFVWLDRRRIPPGHCQNCGYNLTGNVSGMCPECGRPI